MPLRLFAPRYWPTWFGLAVLRVFATLPFAVLRVIGRLLGRIFGWTLTKFGRTARRNLELCLRPDGTTVRHPGRHQHCNVRSARTSKRMTLVEWSGTDAFGEGRSG